MPASGLDRIMCAKFARQRTEDQARHTCNNLEPDVEWSNTLGGQTGCAYASRRPAPTCRPTPAALARRTTLETTQGQKDGFFSPLLFKCYLPEVASVGN